MIDRGKKNIVGVLVDAIDYEAAVEKIIEAANLGKPYSVSASAVHGVMTGVMNNEHRYRLNQFDLVAPDGQPVRWALNLLHKMDLKERVYGPELMRRVCERAAEMNLPLFLFGSHDEVLRALTRNLTDSFPNLQISGAAPSKFRKISASERENLMAEIRGSGAAITFVGLGCPRQEIWTYENVEELSMPVIAVGAAFDFHAGSLSQAPKFMQNAGLEWLYRFIQEPTRLWRRYLLLNPSFVFNIFLQALGLKAFPVNSGRKPKVMENYG